MFLSVLLSYLYLFALRLGPPWVLLLNPALHVASLPSLFVYLFRHRCAPYGTTMSSIVVVMAASLILGVYFLLADKLWGSTLTQYQNTNQLYKQFDTDYARWVSKVLWDA